MKPATFLLIATCLSLGFGAGLAAERFGLSSRDNDLTMMLKEFRATREALANLQRSNSECLRSSLLCSAAVRDSAPAGGRATEATVAPAQAPSVQAAASAPTPENLAAYDEGEKLVSSAMTRGAWTRNDRLELSRLGQDMSDEQFLTLQQQVTQAVNQDKLKLELP
ncbi:MAG TPA: hypothetical protein VEX18_15180 [Polyangiaceae bacterium]|nr:hypothetical protein [Polyangiaceae bacterium]